MTSTIHRSIAVVAALFAASTSLSYRSPACADTLSSAGSPNSATGSSGNVDSSPYGTGAVAASANETHPLTTVGAQIPAHLQLIDIRGKPFNLNAAVAAKPTVLIFYRGSWCPYCNAQMSQLQDLEPKLEELGYQILAISPDLPENLRSSIGAHHLTYTLLSDSKMQASQAFGLAYRVDDGLYSRMSSFGIDLQKVTGTTQRELPVPAAYVLDRTGAIRFAYANPDFKVRVDPAKLLAAAISALPATSHPG